MPTRSNKNSTKKDEMVKKAAKKTPLKVPSSDENSINKPKRSKVTAKKTTTVKSNISTKKASKTSSSTPKNSVKSQRNLTAKRTTKPKEKVISEYFDLPDTYNKTTVKVLFQTPKKLFVYWEISEDDKKRLLDENGKDFFETSTPFLLIHNITKSYSFEIQINDYANSWYFDIPDSNCEYQVELIRKYNNIPIQIKTSNELEVPNNHILFEKSRKEIFFKNIKTSHVSSKNIVSLHFINHLGVAQPVTLNAFYNKFYNEKDLYSPNNPSSSL